MATSNKPATPSNIPAAFAGGTEHEGHNLTDKKALVDVPFMIFGIEVERSDRDYDVAYVYAVDAKGNEFEFSDTSKKGIRQQLQDIMVASKMDPAPGAGFQKFPQGIILMNGLRFIDFPVEDKRTGKMVDGEIYYLSAKSTNRR